MKFNCDDHDHMTIVQMSGDFSHEYVDAFRRAMSERLGRGVRDFVLQMNEVQFIDSLALETLLWLQESSAELLGQIRLVDPSPNLRKILEMTRLDHYFEAQADVPAAVKSLR